MLIEMIDQRRCEVFVSDRELGRYHLDPSGMSASKAGTRILLGDILGALGNMGMRKKGETALVEWTRTGGGCLMEVTVSDGAYRFDSRADLEAAVRAGVTEVSEGRLLRDREGYLLCADVEEKRRPLLTEFARKISDITP